MKGETVIVRAYGNQPLVRRVWEADDFAVYIVTDENFQRLEARQKALNPVGFARDDVFFYDDKALREIRREYKKNPSAWNKLRVYTGRNGSNGSGERKAAKQAEATA